MSAFTVASKTCPVCHQTAVKKTGGTFSFKGATHWCEHCHATLRVVVTRSIWWTAPALLVCLGLVFELISWINKDTAMSGMLRAVLIGGAVGLCWGACIAIAQRGLAYEAVSS